MESPNPEPTRSGPHDLAARERKLAVCSGASKLDPTDRIEMLMLLTTDQDPVVAEQSHHALLSQPLDVFVTALKRPEAMQLLFAYATDHLTGKPGIADALVENKNCPGKFLASHVNHMSAASVQALMEELERVSDSSALAAALLHSNSSTVDHKMLLNELLAPGEPADETVLEEALIEEVIAETAPVPQPDPSRQTMLQRIAKMTVSQRVQFAIKGGSEARRTLIRDSNKVVQRAVLQSPRLTGQEVEAFASQSSLTDEILRIIATKRAFRKNYAVTRNLLNNSKTPLDVSLGMLPLLNPLDLKKLTTNKNVPETLRTMAIKLQRQRQEFKK
ncbi:MAG: hypothetical protein PVS2B2_03640 [Candidatus Acidiferrum sp.]